MTSKFSYPDLDAFQEARAKCVNQVLEMWRTTPTKLEFDHPDTLMMQYTRRVQQQNARALRRLVLKKALADKLRLRFLHKMLREQFINQWNALLGLPRDQDRGEILQVYQFLVHTTNEFVKAAKNFDEMSMGDVFKAGRTLWFMVAWQLMVGVEPRLTSAMVGYNLLYPYTDNFVDNPDISSEDKATFAKNFRDRLRGMDVVPRNKAEEDIYRLVGYIEQNWSHEAHGDVYHSLVCIHDAQTASVTQMLSNYKEDVAAAAAVATAVAVVEQDAKGAAAKVSADAKTDTSAAVKVSADAKTETAAAAETAAPAAKTQTAAADADDTSDKTTSDNATTTPASPSPPPSTSTPTSPSPPSTSSSPPSQNNKSKKKSKPPTPAELKAKAPPMAVLEEISANKGGASVMAAGFVTLNDMSYEKMFFLEQLGFGLQLLDDLQDVREDLVNGQMTLFSTRIVAGQTLDEPVAQLLNYINNKRVLAPFSDLSPSQDTLSYYVRKALIPFSTYLVLEAAAKLPEHFSPKFFAEMSTLCPFPISQVRAANLRIEDLLFEFLMKRELL